MYHSKNSRLRNVHRDKKTAKQLVDELRRELGEEVDDGERATEQKWEDVFIVDDNTIEILRDIDSGSRDPEYLKLLEDIYSGPTDDFSIDDYLEAYERGLSVMQTADEFNVHPVVVRAKLARYGI